MRKYEIMLILPAEADDKVIGGVTDRITGVLGPGGGEVTRTDRWGKRRFAYPIGKVTEGFYLVSEFSAEPGILRELDRVLSLADDVIRFKVVVRPDKEGVPDQAAQPTPEAKATEKPAPAPEPPVEEAGPAPEDPASVAEAQEETEEATADSAAT